MGNQAVAVAFAAPCRLSPLPGRAPLRRCEVVRRVHAGVSRPRACATLPAADVDPAAAAPQPEDAAQQWPDPPALSEASGALRKAMYAVLRGEAGADAALRDVLQDGVQWSSPVVNADSRAGVVEALGAFTGFMLEPVVLFTGEVEDGDGLVRLEWLLSFVWPTPWRPQVTLSGRSLLTLSPGKESIVKIVDEWDASPWNAVRQALPRLRDILWLYPSPHAEIDLGTRKVLAKHDGYAVVRVAARPEMRIVGEVLNPREANDITAFPAIPPEAFNGGLRRREVYSTVSPVSVRQLSDTEYEFSVPIPGAIFGSSRNPPLPEHPAKEVRVSLSPSRRCAVVRYPGFAKNELFEKQLETLVGKLQRDGYLPADHVLDRSSVWARQYDSKIGFNEKSEVAIGTGGAPAYGVPRRWNELLIELPC